jgi:hypothetical protein
VPLKAQIKKSLRCNEFESIKKDGDKIKSLLKQEKEVNEASTIPSENTCKSIIDFTCFLLNFLRLESSKDIKEVSSIEGYLQSIKVEGKDKYEGQIETLLKQEIFLNGKFKR